MSSKSTRCQMSWACGSNVQLSAIVKGTPLSSEATIAFPSVSMPTPWIEDVLPPSQVYMATASRYQPVGPIWVQYPPMLSPCSDRLPARLPTMASVLP